MAINSSGIRDAIRVPGVSKTTVMNVMKGKEILLLQVNPNITTMKFSGVSRMRFEPACEMEPVNQVWTTDITYIPMELGFMYLIAIMDWLSRRVLA